MCDAEINLFYVSMLFLMRFQANCASTVVVVMLLCYFSYTGYTF